MSSTLYWSPVEPPKGKHLKDSLKYILRQRFDCGHVDHQMDESDINYLEGLVDAGLKEAKPLLDAIKKHGAIHLVERF